MLFIVSTPIGNLKDITLRAQETLSEADAIICEDTRKTGNLLHHLGIKKPMTIFNDHNEEVKLVEIISRLEKGENMALVSDSGTPLISDPGYKLIKEARKRNIPITAVPGPSAVITALTLSGLPTDKFMFLGFLPKSSGKRKNFLKGLLPSITVLQENKVLPTLIFYESPHRLQETLLDLQEIFGDIEIVLAKELTKIFESVKKDLISEHLKGFSHTSPKGEYVVLFSPQG